jgi:hypothetical protein
MDGRPLVDANRKSSAVASTANHVLVGSRLVAMRYRVLGYESAKFTREQLEDLVRRGLLTIETKVIADGEAFATALVARAEFEDLVRSLQKLMPG